MVRSEDNGTLFADPFGAKKPEKWKMMQQQMPDAGHTREAEQVGSPPTIVALSTLTARQNQPVLGDATKIR